MSRLRCLLLIASLGAGVPLGACGGSHNHATTSPDGFGQRGATPFLGDGDFDHGDGDPDNNSDNDSDIPFDYYTRKNESWNRGYFHDRDDTSKLTLGRSADTIDTQAISTVVRRYYSAASRDDGRRACAMLLPSIAASITNYNRTGIPYLRGSKTCQVAMTRLFRHFNLSVPQVTGIRLDGAIALALWGSRTMPAGYITLQRWHKTWAITEPVSSPLL
jgi:hypothetical protein